MSRSYKKNPYCTDNSSSKARKQIANRLYRRRIRDCRDIPGRSHYKKVTESWFICDYKWRMTEQEAIDYWTQRVNDPYFMKSWPTLDKYMKMWYKYHYRK